MYSCRMRSEPYIEMTESKSGKNPAKSGPRGIRPTTMLQLVDHDTGSYPSFILDSNIKSSRFILVLKTA